MYLVSCNMCTCMHVHLSVLGHDMTFIKNHKISGQMLDTTWKIGDGRYKI